MDIPFWDIVGNAMVTPQQIRLTADLQSLRGGLWNKVVSGEHFKFIH